MMACKCYHAERNFIGKIGVCWGTKECEACTCGGDESICDFYEDKRKKAQEALKPVSDFYTRWIPVTERLPERYDDDVLCYVCNVDSNRHFISVGNYSRLFRIWDLDTEWATSRDVVTHWMPLPGMPTD